MFRQTRARFAGTGTLSSEFGGCQKDSFSALRLAGSPSVHSRARHIYVTAESSRKKRAASSQIRTSDHIHQTSNGGIRSVSSFKRHSALLSRSNSHLPFLSLSPFLAIEQSSAVYRHSFRFLRLQETWFIASTNDVVRSCTLRLETGGCTGRSQYEGIL